MKFILNYWRKIRIGLYSWIVGIYMKNQLRRFGLDPYGIKVEYKNGVTNITGEARQMDSSIYEEILKRMEETDLPKQ